MLNLTLNFIYFKLCFEDLTYKKDQVVEDETFQRMYYNELNKSNFLEKTNIVDYSIRSIFHRRVKKFDCI